MENSQKMPDNVDQFTVPDYILFSLVLFISLAIGFYSAFKCDNSITSEYLVGGGKMPVIPVALSLVGGAISAISILGEYIHVKCNFFFFPDFYLRESAVRAKFQICILCY